MIKVVRICDFCFVESEIICDWNKSGVVPPGWTTTSNSHYLGESTETITIDACPKCIAAMRERRGLPMKPPVEIDTRP